MNKYLILSIVLLNCYAVQAMQKKADIGSYVEKARASAKEPGSRAWVKQLEELQNKQLLSEKTLELGVPSGKQVTTPKYQSRFWNYWLGNYKRIGKKYYLSKDFDTIYTSSEENAFDLSHYEIYFMPDDNQLYNAFDRIIRLVKYFFENVYDKKDDHSPYANVDAPPQGKLKQYIDFIAIRPTPGITKSPYDGKNMPRIIIGIGDMIWGKKVIENLIYFLSETTKDIGCVGTPRYSIQVPNSCIFWRFGSPDTEDQYFLKKPQGRSSLFSINKNKPTAWEPSKELIEKTRKASKMKW